MNKVEKNLRNDGFTFKENSPVDGVLEVSKGEFSAYWIEEKSTGRMPKFLSLFDGSYGNGGTYKTNDYETFLCAIVTNEFDFVEYTKQENKKAK